MAGGGGVGGSAPVSPDYALKLSNLLYAPGAGGRYASRECDPTPAASAVTVAVD
jgi:hypothetical protein